MGSSEDMVSEIDDHNLEQDFCESLDDQFQEEDDAETGNKDRLTLLVMSTEDMSILQTMVSKKGRLRFSTVERRNPSLE
jgi:hypothetical protein